ncbi:cell surface hyaluronidase-like [Pollicipes pollicipes]|uniref:cell surface hyaluronidase-like n=1 Tax=Pollicipes pollicipes TaxID=41117 RepID=UPI0018855013|nr:cell surface hyaluronidase-like [Pollicipes pollicipes]
MVHGELWVGSEDCPFAGQAELELLGRKGDSDGVEAGGSRHVKALVVADGGRLEVHGAPRRAWSRLTATLPKTTREAVVGSPIFDQQQSEWHNSRHRGFLAYEFDEGGQVIGFLGLLHRVADFQALAAKTDSVILLVLQRQVSFSDGEDVTAMADALSAACFNGEADSAISGFTDGQAVAWAAICHVGHPENSVEEVGHEQDGFSVTSRLTRTIGTAEFVVYSETELEDGWPSTADVLSYAPGTIPPRTMTLSLEDDVSDWSAGDTIVVTSTDYDWRQAEEFISIESPAEFTHWGETTDGVRMAAEVALLNRNVRIHGRMEDACYGDNNCDDFSFDTFGGHVKVLAGFQAAHIANAEVFHMGQNSVLGAYPIHFHMCGDVSAQALPPYVRSNAIHHTFARCVTVHGTSGLLVEDNVAFDHYGHCFFLEDGAEQNTVLRGNLGLSTRRTSITPTDQRMAATFWITNPLTTMEGNVAAGSDAYGIWYTFPLRPIGPSALRTPLAPFVDNVAHSNNDYGLRLDDLLKTNGGVGGRFAYDPREDPLDPTSSPVTVTLRGYNGYKNYKSAWLRGASLVAEDFSIAETVEGVVFASSAPGSKRLVRSRLVGETANKGKPEGWIPLANGTTVWWDRQIRMGGANRALPIIGAIFLDGPVSLEDVSFHRFATNAVRPSGAIGLRRALRWYTSPANRVAGVTFDFADPADGNRVYDASEGQGFADLAGNIHSVFRDIDGSLTTYAGATVVKPYAVHLNARCAPVPNWNLYVCPAAFTKFKLEWYDMASSPVTFVTRDDGSATHSLPRPRQISYALNSEEGYILHFNTSVPRSFSFTVTGLEAGVEQRLGVCIGRDATDVRISLTGIPTPTFEDLLTGSPGTQVFHDRERGLLLFRFRVPYALSADTETECPGGGPYGACPVVKVSMAAAGEDGDCSERAYPTYATAPLDAAGGLVTPSF